MPESILFKTDLPMPSENDPNSSGTGPGVLRAEAQVEMAKFGKSAAVRSLWPELNGFAAYSFRSGSDRDFSGEWAAGLNLRIPLFDAGRRLSSIQAAESGLEAAENRYRDALITEHALGETAKERIRSLQSRKNLLSRGVEKKESSVLAFRERYSEGRLSLSELLTQEAELLQLKLQERSLLYQGVSAYIDYHYQKGSLTTGLIESLVEKNLGGQK
jgi:outer membrane protein TolC